MSSKKVCLGTMLFTLAALAAPVSTTSAQWSATAIGVAEYDTDETLLLLAGVSAGPGGMGWSPRIGVQGYHLGFDAGASRTNVVVVRPYVGMRNGFTGGSASISLGYAFSNRDTDAPAIVADRGDGVVLSGGWDYWGTGGPFGYQLLGSYNFGTESIWTRARGTTRIQQRANGQTRLGAEVAYLSDNDNFSGFQPGAVLELHGSNGVIIGLGAGVKIFEGNDNNPVYFKLEGVLPLGR